MLIITYSHLQFLWVLDDRSWSCGDVFHVSSTYNHVYSIGLTVAERQQLEDSITGSVNLLRRICRSSSVTIPVGGSQRLLG